LTGILASRRLYEDNPVGVGVPALVAKLKDAYEAERVELARELHDEMAQVLTSLKLGVGEMRVARGRDLIKALDRAESAVDQLLGVVRSHILTLRPAALETEGLLKALRSHFSQYTEQTGVTVRFVHRGIDRRFSMGIETGAYRVVQEALTNVARHARVKDVRVDVRANARWLSVTVVDKGKGFDTARRPRDTFGLLGMEERVHFLGGRFEIVSSAGGTRVKAVLPLPLIASASPVRLSNKGDR
jgi:signal transduction histidine kinase